MKKLGLISLLLTVAILGEGVVRVDAAVPTIELVAVLASVKGDVEVRTDSKRDWVDAADGMKLRTGDAVRTKSGGSCVIKWARGNIMKLTPFTEIVLDKLVVTPATKTELSSMALRKGRIFAKAKKLAADSSFSVSTPTAIAAVRGTRFSVMIGKDGSTEIGCTEGRLLVKSHSGEEVVLDEGKKVNVGKGQPPGEPEDISDEEKELFLGHREIDIPGLVVLDPAGDMETFKTPLRVRGFTDPGVTIAVNGKKIPVSITGEFSMEYELDVGRNMIVIEAKNDRGMELEKEYDIEYFPSVRGVASGTGESGGGSGEDDDGEEDGIDVDEEALSENLEPGGIEITFPPPGYVTREPAIAVSGRKPAGTAMLVVNGKPVKTAAPLRTTFSTRADLVAEGANTIEVAAVRGASMISDSVEVIRDTIPPDITVVKPAGQFDVTTGDCELLNSSPYCEVAGYTEPGAILTINDIRQELETDGSFSAMIPVDPSVFRIKVAAEDQAGNRSTEIITRMPLDLQEIAYLSVDVNPGSIVADNVSTAEITVNGLNHYMQPVSGVDVFVSTNATGGYLSATSISLFDGKGTATFHAGVSGLERKTITITASKNGVSASAQLVLLPDFPAQPDE